MAIYIFERLHLHYRQCYENEVEGWAAGAWSFDSHTKLFKVCSRSQRWRWEKKTAAIITFCFEQVTLILCTFVFVCSSVLTVLISFTPFWCTYSVMKDIYFVLPPMIQVIFKVNVSFWDNRSKMGFSCVCWVTSVHTVKCMSAILSD